jgi:3-methyladenine DNA glycosylase AlkD
LHDKKSDDRPFADSLPLIERAATDDRNFVKKGVSWALRGVGRRSPDLKASSLELAKRLAASPNSAARWIGKDALRDLTRSKNAS